MNTLNFASFRIPCGDSTIEAHIPTDHDNVFQPTSSGLRFAFLLAHWNRTGVIELQNREVLDIGCGAGILSIVCEKLGARVTASDIAQGTHEIIRSVNHLNGTTITSIEADGTSETIKYGPFDLIAMNAPIFPNEHDTYGDHLILDCLENAKALLKPNGSIIFHITDIIRYEQIFRAAMSSSLTARPLTSVVECISRPEFWEEYKQLDLDHLTKQGLVRTRFGKFFLRGEHIKLTRHALT